MAKKGIQYYLTYAQSAKKITERLIRAKIRTRHFHIISDTCAHKYLHSLCSCRALLLTKWQNFLTNCQAKNLHMSKKSSTFAASKHKEIYN